MCGRFRPFWFVLFALVAGIFMALIFPLWLLIFAICLFVGVGFMLLYGRYW